MERDDESPWQLSFEVLDLRLQVHQARSITSTILKDSTEHSSRLKEVLIPFIYFSPTPTPHNHNHPLHPSQLSLPSPCSLSPFHCRDRALPPFILLWCSHPAP